MPLFYGENANAGGRRQTGALPPLLLPTSNQSHEVSLPREEEKTNKNHRSNDVSFHKVGYFQLSKHLPPL